MRLAPVAGVARGGSTSRANHTGSGAVAQGDGDELGERCAKAGGGNYGTMATGTQIVSNHRTTSERDRTREGAAQQVGGYLCRLRSRMESIELRGIERIKTLAHLAT